MLVEDDNNLREIYEARLLAEGYEIVSARDGEEALALAVKERPDLIIADVMMPKISGFDMLDILRSTPETKNTKVIMMTALSQAEDKARAAQLGADRYLVKSQVTLEDVAKVAHEVLEGEAHGMPTATSSTPPPEPTTPSDVPPADNPPPAPPPSEPPASPPADDPKTPPPAAEPPPADNSAATVSALGQTTQDEATAVQSQIDNFASEGVAATSAASPAPATTLETGSRTTLTEQPSGAPPADNSPVVPVASPGTSAERPKFGSTTHSRVIQPLNDLSQTGPDLAKLLEKEQVKEQMANVAQEILHKNNNIPGLNTAPGSPPPASPPPATGMTDPNAIAL